MAIAVRDRSRWRLSRDRYRANSNCSDPVNAGLAALARLVDDFTDQASIVRCRLSRRASTQNVGRCA